MLAVVLKKIGQLVIQEHPSPETAPGEVRIRVAVTGICGSDIHGYTGENGRRQPGQIMGHESSGWVEAIGAERTDLSIGQAVTFNPLVVPPSQAAHFLGREQHCPDRYVIGVTPDRPAAFASHVTVPARNVVPLPPSMPVEHGALVEPIAVALHAVRRVLRPDQHRALVIGGGPIGQSLVLALQMLGLEEVFVSEVDPARRALIGRLGGVPLDPTSIGLAAELASRGGPVDVAFDAVGLDGTIRDAFEATALGSSVCLVGMGSPTLTLDAFRISTDERSLVGSFTYSAQDFVDAASFVADAGSRVDELISREVQPNEADSAFQALAKGDGTPGKVLVRFNTR